MFVGEYVCWVMLIAIVGNCISDRIRFCVLQRMCG